ncbi:hypothetical protein EZS27_008002 [termite gut metagenome]|uniref:Uncharacterized protein n=1 Tax=termite gut metagenome TaxID=433724 RepID=A0A5J4SDW5_9ZZZZ
MSKEGVFYIIEDRHIFKRNLVYLREGKKMKIRDIRKLEGRVLIELL